MRNKDKESPASPDYNGDASTEYYHNAEMAKLTESEGEFMPADDEWKPGPKCADKAKAAKDRLEDFFENDFDDLEDGFFFTDPEDDEILRKYGLKHQRDLAAGQNLNNSFGCYSPEDWDHLHVDKGAN